MDKLKVTNHIKDIELKNKMFKIIDKVNSSVKNYDVRYTDFLNPYEARNAGAILNSNIDIKYKIDGGYELAERKMITIYPYNMKEIDRGLRVFQISGNFKDKVITHKDYLGAILNLGIKREKIGDILVHDDYCQVIVAKDISSFILFNLEKVSRNNVEIKEINTCDLHLEIKDNMIKNSTVSSNRLDCVISSIYNISRQESMKYISSEKVHVNFGKVTSNSKCINDGDLISVRGKGRSRVLSLGEMTKKGRLKLMVEIFN